MHRFSHRNASGILQATAGLFLGLATAGCGEATLEPDASPSFRVRPGVEIVTVTEADPKVPLTLYDSNGKKLLTLVTDSYGQAHFAYIPSEYMVIDTETGMVPVADGEPLQPGDGYVIRNDAVDPPDSSSPFRVLAVDEVPDTELFGRQSLEGTYFGMFAPPTDVIDQGFQYIEMRDGVKLGVMVRFPDPVLWGNGPWPTVVEYSGYSPSRPDIPEPGSRIATLLGFASVGVNMRGTGCSGGVFDVFNPAQHADGYDIIEIVARQPWVLHNKVGMVGLSYSGISQLFVGRTRPPSLSAIAPMSVIADPWLQQWPGGVYNDGFTRQWLEQRDAQAASGGQQWTDMRIANGDTICDEHQRLRSQNLDFGAFFKLLEYRPAAADTRSLPELVHQIEAPVFLTGAWQDEQTGPEFANMIDHFTGTTKKKFTMFNGRHPDGYSSLMIGRWLEHLELYVAKRVPRFDTFIRKMVGEELSKEFGVPGLGMEPDRFADFADTDYEGVLAAYEAEPHVRVLFESGAGPTPNGQVPGAPSAVFESSFETWPPPNAKGRSFYFGPDGTLSDSPPVTAGTDSYLHDPNAASKTFFGPSGYELMKPVWDIDWTQFPAGHSLSYITAPFAENTVIAGPGWAELFVSSDVADASVQVTLTAVRPDNTEYLLQSGWLRLGHRKINEKKSDEFRIVRSFLKEDFEPLVPGQVVSVKVPIASVSHAFRVGSRLRVSISAPGRNHGTWTFENPDYGGQTPKHKIAHGAMTPSRVYLPTITGVPMTGDFPACPMLRGQPCRTYVPSVNTTE